MDLRRDSSETKRKILTVCVRLFLEQGYKSTSVSQIVDEAGKAFISRVIKGSADKDIADFERDIDGCSSINTLFQALFNMMKERISERDKNLENATVRPIREAKKYVCDHFSESVTLEEISGILGFSSSYFSVLFKKETGEGFAKYLTHLWD